MSTDAEMIGKAKVRHASYDDAGRRIWLVVLAAGLVLASTASATSAATSSHVAKSKTRYASPHGGSTGACARRHPCELGRAFDVAQSGDTVEILAGKYGSASKPFPDFTISDGKTLTIRGEAGKSAPIIFTGPETRIDAPADSTLSHLEIHHVGMSPALYVGAGAVADHLDVIAGPQSPEACLIFDGTLVDSTCFAKGQDAFAVDADDFDGSASTIALDGVDAIASGEDGIAVHGQATYSSTLTLNVVDTIMEGAEADLFYGASDIVDTSIVNVDHSDFRTVETDPTGDGSEALHTTHDIKVRPDLRDVLGGDFRERAQSRTIDAGTTKGAPHKDLLGNQRTAGRTIDIGAYEFQPAPTFKHLHVTKGRGEFHASVDVNPGRLATTIQLIAVHDGQKLSGTAESAGAGKSYRPVTLALSNLDRRTTYDVYVRARSSGGSSKTTPLTIKTR